VCRQWRLWNGIQADWEKETVLYRFKGSPDGANPSAGLILDAKGNLYGVTSGGGADGCGTVFELAASGKETVLHSFTSVAADGALPYSTLIMDANGNFCGTASADG
jgi:uncharacterized repeat protein (TIGR03803 family)